MKPPINFFPKINRKLEVPKCHFLSSNPVKVNIIPYEENTKISFLRLLK